MKVILVPSKKNNSACLLIKLKDVFLHSVVVTRLIFACPPPRLPQMIKALFFLGHYTKKKEEGKTWMIATHELFNTI